MLIEQTIELQLRGHGLTCTSITGYFHDKTKVSKENLRVDYYLQLKCSKKQCGTLRYTVYSPTNDCLEAAQWRFGIRAQLPSLYKLLKHRTPRLETEHQF